MTLMTPIPNRLDVFTPVTTLQNGDFQHPRVKGEQKFDFHPFTIMLLHYTPNHHTPKIGTLSLTRSVYPQVLETLAGSSWKTNWKMKKN